MASLGRMPPWGGTALEPFPYDLLSDDVEFVGILDNPGIHGVIVKAKVKDRLYAIKFFTETDVSTPEHEATEYPQIPEEEADEFESHFIPFYAECRAFARLREAGREDLAVKVHGHVSVKVDQALEAKMSACFAGREADGMILEDLFITFLPGAEIKGIVKDFVEPVKWKGRTTWGDFDVDIALSVRHFPKMLEDLHEIHKLGIVIRDVSVSQYVNGVLVDFSMAWTMPHPFGPGGRGLWPSWTFKSVATWDLWCFQDRVIDWWNIHFQGSLIKKEKPCMLRAYPDHKYATRARPLLLVQQPYLPMVNHEEIPLVMAFLPKYDPGAYGAEEVMVVKEGKKRARGGGEERAGHVRKKRKAIKMARGDE